jgi:hypothetical protein
MAMAKRRTKLQQRDFRRDVNLEGKLVALGEVSVRASSHLSDCTTVVQRETS